MHNTKYAHVAALDFGGNRHAPQHLMVRCESYAEKLSRYAKSIMRGGP
jgi:hypothetical protein